MKFIGRLLILSIAGLIAVACEHKNDPSNDPYTKINNAYDASARMNDILDQLNGQNIYLKDPTLSEAAVNNGTDPVGLTKIRALLDEYIQKGDVVMASYRIDETRLKRNLTTMLTGAQKLRAMIDTRLAVVMPRPPSGPLPNDLNP